MKISLQDKKTLSNFLEEKSYTGRVIESDGISLYATWSNKTLIAKWSKGKLILIPSSDKGVKKYQDLISNM